MVSLCTNALLAINFGYTCNYLRFCPLDSRQVNIPLTVCKDNNRNFNSEQLQQNTHGEEFMYYSLFVVCLCGVRSYAGEGCPKGEVRCQHSNQCYDPTKMMCCGTRLRGLEKELGCCTEHLRSTAGKHL